MTWRCLCSAESCLKRFKLGRRLFDFSVSLFTAGSFYPPNTAKMTPFLQIASRVEAAVEAYISVRDFANTEEWKAMFMEELVSAHLHGVSHSTFEIE